MSISERILRKKDEPNGKPHIQRIVPAAALPGGEIKIIGNNLKPADLRRPHVDFGEIEGSIVVSSEDFIIARVPEEATSGEVVVESNGDRSNLAEVQIGIRIAEGVHPVANPAVDAEGNIFVTLSGSRGQKTPVSIYKVDTDYEVKPFVSNVMNATGLAFDHEGQLYASSRQEGTVYRVTPSGSLSVYAEGMGIATGIAFDGSGNLYVGDRSGTIFKISRERDIFVFTTLEPSVSAYHLAFGADGNLYVTGPTTSSYDAVYRVDPHGTVTEFYRGLGRPQGMAFDIEGNLYVAASLGGKRGIVRITPERQISLAVSGNGIVGLAFAPGKAGIVATNNSVHYLSWGIQGMPLFG